MALLEAGLDPIILATDISDEARELGAAGIYPVDRVADLPVRWRQRFFHELGDGRVEISSELRAAVTFLPNNLAVSTRPPGGWGSFDVVVCRNVLLYFERRQASRILREVAETVRQDGYVLLSAAEHPLAWSVRTLGWERSDDAPWLRRQRESSQRGLVPPVSAFVEEKTPLPTRSHRQPAARARDRAPRPPPGPGTSIWRWPWPARPRWSSRWSQSPTCAWACCSRAPAASMKPSRRCAGLGFCSVTIPGWRPTAWRSAWNTVARSARRWRRTGRPAPS